MSPSARPGSHQIETPGFLSCDPAVPVDDAEFAARINEIARFEAAPLVAVAVSGGPDSLALTLLADRWARDRGGRVCALSVDHRLRPESSAELERLALWLRARAIDHRILVWHGEKPASRIQEAARAVRYRLLAEWCRGAGCLHLLIGHHREDQVETHRLRQTAQSGPDGLAAMSAVREIDGCRILRPLLGIAKARLIATLAQRGQRYIEDPSNLNPAFARARLRAAPLNAPVADDESALRPLGCDRVQREAIRNRVLARAVALHPAGFALIEPRVLCTAPIEIAEQALSALVFALSGSAYPPRRRSVARLLWALDGSADAGHADGGVLGGMRFVSWRGRVLAMRELARASPQIAIAPGQTAFWDRRFAVIHSGSGCVLSLGYLGPGGVAELYRRSPPRPGALPPLLYPVLPAFRDEGGLAAVPAIGYARDPGLELPRLCFQPANALTHASFVVV
jgi:tRNA(Ile)-lysidine synthase